MRTRYLAVMAAAVVLAGLLAACGGGKNGGGASDIVIDASNQTKADSAIEVKARNFEFDQSEYRVKTGAVKFHFISEEGVHGIRIPKTGIELRDGQTVTVTFKNPGEYEIVCNIPCGTGHSKMFAKLIVEA